MAFTGRQGKGLTFPFKALPLDQQDNEPDHCPLTFSAFSTRNELGNTSEQVTNVGLDNVSIGSSLMAHLLISLTTGAGKEKNRRVRIVAAHLTTQFKTVEIR